MRKFISKIIIIMILIAVFTNLIIPICNAITINNTDENTEILNTAYTEDNEVNENLTSSSEIINENILENSSTTDEKITNSNIASITSNEDVITQIISSNTYFSQLNSNGIYIQNNIKDDILKILNFNSIYTYTVDENYKLQCDYIKKENTYLDTENETDFDIIIKNYYNTINQKIIILIDNNILIDSLSATSVYENKEYKFVLLNPTYFAENLVNEFHPSLSDYILKGIIYNQYGISLTSSFATTGKSSSSQVVYFGPSTDNYAEIGSVNWHEVVQIIGMTNDWYHITYEIGNSGTYKTGYVPKSNVFDASGPDLYEEQLVGGYRVANRQLDVRSYDIESQSVSIGTVYNTEGITCLYDYTNSDGEKVSYIEFSTGSGTKRGYVKTSYMDEPINYYENGHHYDTTVGYVKYDVNLSMGVGNGYVNTGLALSKDEYVAVLGKENNNLYVEYNTKSGRKRAYTTTDYIELTRHYTDGALNWYPDLPVLYGQKVSNVAQTVYATPSTQGATIGSIDQGEAVYVYMNHKFNDSNNTYSYIAYNTSNGKKTGYVPTSTLSNFTQVELPEFKDFEGAEKTILQSAGDVNGNNKASMAFYKVGTGNNKLYLVFNQHGWEDGYPGDGVELTRISQDFLTVLTDSTHSDILENWTVYVVCDANPNGILNGEDHSGIGRTVPYSGVDMNRAWPTNSWVASTVTIKGKKGYTGTNPTEDCLELKQVKEWLESNTPDSNYKSVLIDVHGWDCEIFGDTSVGAYYNTAETFSTTLSGLPFYSTLYNHAFRNDSRTGGSGYLISWAYQKLGVKNTALLELPYPGDAIMQSDGTVLVTSAATADNNNIEEYNYSGRFITGTLNLLENF